MMATAPQAEAPTTNSKLNNCDSNSSVNSSKLVNGLNSEAHHHNNQNHHGHHQQLPYHHPHPHHNNPNHLGPEHLPAGENNNHGNVMKSQDSQQQNNRGPPHPHQQHPSYNNSYENHHQQQIHHRMNSEGGGGSTQISNSNKGMSDPNSNNAGGPGGGNGPDQGHYPPQQPHPHQQPQYQQYPPYRYDQQPPPQQPPQHNSAPPPPDHPGYGQHPGYPPPMRFPGKPMPGGGPGGGSYPVGRGGYPGQSISQPAGPTPTLNQLLQSSGGANPGNSSRYPAPGPPPGSYDPHNPYSKADYNQGPTGWPPPSPRPPLSSYAHPPPPPFQQQQPLYRQSGPGSRSSSGSAGGPPASSPGGPPPPGGPGQQHPGQPYYQGGPPGHGGYPPPPPQSPHYPPPPHPAQPRYPSPGPGMRPPDNQPSHYPGQLPPGMGPEQSNSSSSGLGSSSGVPPPSGSSSSDHPPKSTPPPPPSPSHMGNHGGQPPSPQQSPRSTPHPPPVNSSASNSSNSCPPPNSPSQHRPQGGQQGSSPSNNYPPPPDVGEVTGCNSNDSVGGANSSSGGPGGVRPSPSPTGSASSRSMSPAVGNQNIPMPPRPSSQSEGLNSNAPRMSQSPLSTAQGGSYPGQPQMAPPPHHHNMYGGKGHPGIPQGPPPPGHYPGQQQPGPPPHWQSQPGGPPPGPGGYPRHPGPPSHNAGSMMGSPYPPPPGGLPPSQQPLPGNSYPPPPPGQRHPIPNHVPGQPGQYPPYPSQQQYPPPPQPGQQQGWPPGGPGNGPAGGATPPPPSGPPSHNSRSQSHYLKHHLQQKLGYGQQQQGGYPMGPPQSSSGSPSQTPPPGHPHHPPPPDITENSSSNNSNPPNIVSVGPDGANVDEGSQASTISNASGASGDGEGPSMPKLRPEGRGNYPSTPQSNAVPSPGAASMGSAQEDYDMNSPGWPRTPASPGINSHPPPPSEHYRGKNKVKKKADSLNKLYDMDDNPDRRMFLDKLIHFMEDQHNPITSCPTISKNPLDLFRLYFLVKERGGFLEVTNKKTWKDIAGSLGIGASSSAAYTLRKHYTKHLLPFECKFDRGGIDPQPLINQTETTGKKKGKGVAPVPSPGSSNSQDSFPGPNNNTNSSSMDGFSSPTSSNYPSNYPPSGPGGEYPTPNSSTPSPLARPNQQTSQNSSQQHPGGDKSQVSVSNPFDDMPPANTQYPYQQPASRLNYHYPPYSSQPPPPPPPSAGYQGPPGSYPNPYGAPEGYGARGTPPIPPPGMPPHEGPYSGQGYPPPQGPPSGPGSYPGQPSRQMYPPYGENLPQNSGVPPSSSANSTSQSPYHTGPGNPPSSQPPPVPPASSQSSINSEDNSNRYSSMAPPATNSYSPGRGQYPPPPGAQGGSPHAPPPNGYPGQDYYHSQPQTDQGYPAIGQGPPSGPPTPGKHMPPPHPNQAMRYPPGKDVPPPAGPGSYPGYPSQPQPGAPPRVPTAYGGPYGPYSSSSSGVGSGSVVGRDVRSSPSPSPVAPTPPQIPSSASAPPPTAASPHSSSTPQSSTKPPPPWIPPPPEGWPGSSGPHYPGQRPPANYPGAPIPGGSAAVPPSGGSTTPTPSQSPGVPVSVGPSLPTQAPPPQTWGSGRVGGPPTTGGVPQWAQPQQPQGPPGAPSGPQGQTEQSVGAGVPGGRYGPSGGSMMSPPPSSSNNSSNQPPWTTPPSSRSGGRPAFPGKPGASPSPSSSSDMYKGYGSPQIQPPSIPTGVPPSVGSPGMMKGPQGQQQQPPPGYHPGQPHHPHQQQVISPQAQPPQVKKEIVFPPDSVEAVTPVFTRRKKLHKNDVAPVEAWRIMMCLKSGLLAETTWALDVLNVLLYDDHSISYFSLTYLPGLLDILLEHLRRALILMFGQSIGIEMVESKEESFKPPPGKCGKWSDTDQESTSDEPDVGMPVRKFPRDCQRTVVLQGSTNYTMVSRIGRKKVGIVAKDEEPFVVPGPRDWDWDEKCRQNETEEMEQLTGTMDVTKHIVTYFSSDLKNVPVVRDLKEESKAAISCVEKAEIKVEKPDEEPELDLKMYQCETKVGKELLLNSNPGTPKTETKVPVPIAANPPTPTESTLIPEKKNCLVGSAILPPASSSPINFTKANLSNKKGRRLDDVLGRLRKDVVLEEDNAMSESPVITNQSGANSESSSIMELPQTESDSVTNSATNTLAPPSVLENGGGESSSNMSMEEDTGACSTPIGGNGLSMDDIENTCDSSRNGRASPRVVQVGELCIKDPASTLKRKRMEDLEDECYTRDESSLFLVTESQDSLARRCLSICNIIRNLTFVPGNDAEFGKCVPFLSLIGKLILLHHEHPVKSRLKLEKKKEDDSEPADVVIDEGEDGLLAATLVDIDADSCTSLSNEDEWWWDYVHHLREHVLVMIANISGQMDLSQFSEEISRPILDGLLHWAVCPAAYGQDPFPTLSPGASLSPQRLAIEALCKLSVIQGNVDLLLATPPYSRIERLAQLLCRSLCRTEEQVMREFSLNLLFYLSAADSGVARTIALQNPCISLLISFIEQAENNAMNIASTHGFSVLRENPEAMGTSLDMLRRAAMTLLNLARHPDNRPLFVQHEPRLLQLVMSQILEQKVAAMVAQVLFQCSTPAEGPNSQKYFYSSANTETFYTPLFSRSRSAQQQQQSHIL